MELIESLVLGLVQGLGEFLPISSSAHLVLVPWAMGWQDPGLQFDVGLHLGTLVAVVIYFRRDLLRLAQGAVRSLAPSSRNMADPDQKLAWLLVVASVPGAAAGFVLEKKAETVFRHPGLIAATLAGFGLVLWAADRLGRKERDIGAVGWRDAFLIGLGQALAVVPGVSRSGATIAAGLGLGLRRADAARFSFLMSIPIIAGAGLLGLRHLAGGEHLQELAIGFAASAVFGYLSIKYLMRYLAEHTYGVFAGYRLAVSAAVLVLLLMRSKGG